MRNKYRKRFITFTYVAINLVCCCGASKSRFHFAYRKIVVAKGELQNYLLATHLTVLSYIFHCFQMLSCSRGSLLCGCHRKISPGHPNWQNPSQRVQLLRNRRGRLRVPLQRLLTHGRPVQPSSTSSVIVSQCFYLKLDYKT